MDGVIGIIEEAFDAQALLDPFEDQLDRSAAFVGPSDGERRQGEIVGQNDEAFAGLRAAARGALRGGAAYRLRVRQGARAWLYVQPGETLAKVAGREPLATPRAKNLLGD